MCKLSAISLDKKYNADPMIPFALLGELLIIQCDRVNNDGTGIGICNEKSLFIKHWSEASKFVFSKQVKEYCMKHGMGESLIGHVRNATNGGRKDSHYLQEDAHPFVYGNIMGAHNGHFTNYKDILKESPELDLSGATIDSAVFFATLAHKLEGNKLNVETLNETIQTFEGSFTVLLHDALQPGVIWLAKGSNPLSSYHWEELGLTIISTSGSDISSAIKGFIPRYNLYTHNHIEIPEKIDTEILASQALFKVDGAKIEKVSALETTKVASRTIYRHTATSKSTSLHRERAEAVMELQLTLGIKDYEELDISFKASDIEEWWEVTPVNLYQTITLAEEYLKNTLHTDKSYESFEELTKVWNSCKNTYRLLVESRLSTLDCYIGITLLEINDDFHVPYYFNDIKLLKEMEETLLSLNATERKNNAKV